MWLFTLRPRSVYYFSLMRTFWIFGFWDPRCCLLEWSLSCSAASATPTVWPCQCFCHFNSGSPRSPCPTLTSSPHLRFPLATACGDHPPRTGAAQHARLHISPPAMSSTAGSSKLPDKVQNSNITVQHRYLVQEEYEHRTHMNGKTNHRDKFCYLVHQSLFRHN